MSFDDQPSLTSDLLLLRPLASEDFEGVYKAASDPATWAGHPARNRHQRDVFRSYFDFLLQAGGTLVIRHRATDAPIGCSRYYVGPDEPGDIGIGFTFLDHMYWGGQVNFDLKNLMLDHAFKTFDRVWFHIDPTNIRSQKATAKLGAIKVDEVTLSLAGTPAPWMRFRLDKDVWADTLQAVEKG